VYFALDLSPFLDFFSQLQRSSLSLLFWLQQFPQDSPRAPALHVDGVTSSHPYRWLCSLGLPVRFFPLFCCFADSRAHRILANFSGCYRSPALDWSTASRKVFLRPFLWHAGKRLTDPPPSAWSHLRDGDSSFFLCFLSCALLVLLIS
jgi:hypothetical protein